MTLRPIQSVLFWILAACLAAGLALAALFIAVNWNDRAPSEAALRLDALARKQPAPVADGNAYSYLLGLDSPQDADPRAVGATRLAWRHKQSVAAPATAFPDTLKPYALQRSPSFATLYAACGQVDTTCAGALHADPVQAVAWVSSEQWILDRYLRLLEHPQWNAFLPVDPELPVPFNLALDSQRLFFVHAWITAGKGEADEVRKLLGKDLAFWRRVLASYDDFTARSAAVMAINRHFMWASVVLRSMPVAEQRQAVPPEWRVPFGTGDYTIMRNVVAEYARVRRAVAGLRERQRSRVWAPVGDFVLHGQDAINRRADAMLVVAKALEKELAQLPAAVSALSSARVAKEGALASWLYNVAGKAVVTPSVAELTAHVTRAADLEGLRRAALLGAQLRSEAVEVADMAARVRESESRNPYTGAPFVWNAQAQAIEFTGLTPAPRGQYLVFY